jgi:hypothetical protein
MSQLARGLCGVLLCVALFGCGGGSSSSSNEVLPAAQSVTIGTITGFGSVIVKGIRFDDRNAVVTVNDQITTTTQLRVGMVVAVEGSVNACPNAATALCEGIATRIRFNNNLEGPITQINRLTNTVQVMGRDVFIDDGTVVEGTGAGDLSGLNIGDVITVSGFNEQNRVRATWLERLGTFVTDATPVIAQGVVANVNQLAGTCTVDGIPVNYQRVTAGNLPTGGLSNGQSVIVRGTAAGNGLVTANQIQLRERISYPDAGLVQVEGYVSNFVSVSNFTVGAQVVDASNAVFLNGSATDLKNGVKVEVEGALAASVLTARRVTFRGDTMAQVVAPLQSKETSTSSVVVLGQRISTTPLTEFIDRTTGPGRPVRSLSYADLAVSDRIDIRAYKDASGKLVATRIERTAPDPLLIAKAAVDAKTPVTSLTILGIDVTTGPNTRYRDALQTLISALDFYSLVQVPPALPSIVRAQGIASPSSVTTIDATRSSSTHGEVALTP